MGVSNYNSDPNANTSISGINIAEGCPPSGINNAIRQIMADIKVADGGYVKTAGDQTIAGEKTFTDSAAFGSAGMGELTISGGSAYVYGENVAGVVSVEGINSSSGGASGYGVELRSNLNGQRGLYDPQNAKWITVTNSAGTATFSGTAVNASSLGGVAAASYALVANVVKLSGDQTIGGTKTFSAETVNFSYSGTQRLQKPVATASTAFPSSTKDIGIYVMSNNDVQMASCHAFWSNDNTGVILHTYNSYGSAGYSVSLRSHGNATEYFEPTNAGIYLGRNASGYKWKQVIAESATISTSDERLKSSIDAIPDVVLDAWGDVDWRQFQFKEAIAEKGADKARLHTGLIAQRIASVFDAHGLDASRYGLWCVDHWDAQPEERDEKGTVVTPAREAEDAYAIRYEEALCMEAAYQRRRADRAEARIASLERRLDEMEAVLASIGGQSE